MDVRIRTRICIHQSMTGEIAGGLDERERPSEKQSLKKEVRPHSAIPSNKPGIERGREQSRPSSTVRVGRESLFFHFFLSLSYFYPRMVSPSLSLRVKLEREKGATLLPLSHRAAATDIRLALVSLSLQEEAFLH